VELDVDNASGILSPGMYADIIWPIARAGGGFTVPVKAVATTTEKTFMILVRGGITEWVEVKRGNASGRCGGSIWRIAGRRQRRYACH
jgi:membrane fusion protein (multidrug efflux system)